MGILGDVKIDPKQLEEAAHRLDPYIMKWLAAAAEITVPLKGGIAVTVSINITGLPNFGSPAKQLPDASQPKEST